jgi:hypothetical protein
MHSNAPSLYADIDNMDFASTKKRVWLFPFFYYRKDEETLFSFIYLIPEWLCLFKNYHALHFHRTFLFPVFYKVNKLFNYFVLKEISRKNPHVLIMIHCLNIEYSQCFGWESHN